MEFHGGLFKFSKTNSKQIKKYHVYIKFSSGCRSFISFYGMSFQCWSFVALWDKGFRMEGFMASV